MKKGVSSLWNICLRYQFEEAGCAKVVSEAWTTLWPIELKSIGVHEQ